MPRKTRLAVARPRLRPLPAICLKRPPKLDPEELMAAEYRAYRDRGGALSEFTPSNPDAWAPYLIKQQGRCDEYLAWINSRSSSPVSEGERSRCLDFFLQHFEEFRAAGTDGSYDGTAIPGRRRRFRIAREVGKTYNQLLSEAHLAESE
jgi:hypothetical protein